MTDMHGGDAITIWGMTPSQIYSWYDGLGATGYTGLTLVTEPNGPSAPAATLTLTGFSKADLTDGHITAACGREGGVPYLYVSAH